MNHYEMLETLLELIQTGGLQGDTEQELLNFVSELQEIYGEDTLSQRRSCIVKFVTQIDDMDKLKRIYNMAQYLWLKE